jgi:hypothetical protein
MEPEHTSTTQAGEQSGGERRAPPQPPQQAPPRAAAAAARPDFYQGSTRDHPIRVLDASAASRSLTTMAHQDVFLGKPKHKIMEWNGIIGFLGFVQVTCSSFGSQIT